MTATAKDLKDQLAVERYESAVDEAIAACDGDTRGALKALIIANEYLESELSSLCVAVSSGYARQRVRKPKGKSE